MTVLRFDSARAAGSPAGGNAGVRFERPLLCWSCPRTDRTTRAVVQSVSQRWPLCRLHWNAFEALHTGASVEVLEGHGYRFWSPGTQRNSDYANGLSISVEELEAAGLIPRGR